MVFLHDIKNTFKFRQQIKYKSKEAPNSMSEKVKPMVEELQKKVEDVTKLANEYRAELEEIMKRRPLESAGIIFVAGLVLGILIGTSTSRRS